VTTKRILTNDLVEFLKLNIPVKKKSKNISLAVIDPKLAQIITDELKIPVQVGEIVTEIARAIRYHLHKYLKISEEDLIKSQLGLGHSYSRQKCMFDVNRQDKPVIQSIALIDQLDKDINSFCMRIKEWFGWHFPELSKIVGDNYIFVRIVKLVEKRQNIIDKESELVPEINEITLDEEITKQIVDAAKTSMGSDISDIDLFNVNYFCEKVSGLIRYREELLGYLKEKMQKLAPNISALVGETVAARLISHAGSLTALAKYPASTIQILGAEKALFRALKTRGKTPKYGLLYHSSFIGKAKLKNKGKISRYLANKLAMCSRIDYFSPDVCLLF
jgi:nucleolar protein 56